MNIFNNPVPPCMYCGCVPACSTGSSISRNNSEVTVATKSYHVIDLLFRRIYLSLCNPTKKANEFSIEEEYVSYSNNRFGTVYQFGIQELFALSTTSKCFIFEINTNQRFIETSKKIWVLIMKSYISNGLLPEQFECYREKIETLPLIHLMKSVLQIDTINKRNSRSSKATVPLAPIPLKANNDCFICHVVKRNYTELLEFLLPFGVNVNACNEWDTDYLEGKTGLSLLMLAASNNNKRAVQALIEARADIEQTVDSHTALEYANKACALALLNAGADILSVFQQIRSVSEYTKDLNHFKASSMPMFITEMAAHGLLESRDGNDDKTVLLKMASHGQETILRMCLGAGANINTICTKFGRTALMHAINICHRSSNSEGCLDTVKTLIGAGADVNIRDKNGQTALGHAKNKTRNSRKHQDILTTIIQVLEKVGAIE